MTELFTKVPDITVIAGHQFTLPFAANRADGGNVDFTLSGTEIKFILTPWGEHNNAILVLSLSANPTQVVVGMPTNNFDVTLLSSDTYDLHGSFDYQIELTSPDGDIFRPIRGALTIVPRNAEVN